MDKQAYIESRAWLKNQYLIIPPGTKQSMAGSAHKKCQCCEQVQFTSEFPDYESEQFLDGKLPVCITCFRMSDDTGRNIVRDTGITIACKNCSDFKPLDEYSYTKQGNTLKTACRACGRKAFNEAK